MRIDRLKIFLDSMGGGAWPFLVGGVICLVNSDNERDLNLLNSYANFIGVDFLEGPSPAGEGGARQRQVCDALRCSGPHARYTDWFREFSLCSKGMGNL